MVCYNRTMEKLTRSKILLRAGSGTKDFFGWSRRTPFLLLLPPVVGLLIGWLFFGLEAAMEQLIGLFVWGLAPICAVATGIFVYNLWWSPIRLAREAVGEAETNRQDLESQVRELGATRPSIKVELANTWNLGRLWVENHGSAGEFTAKARVIEPQTLGDADWPIRWRGTLEPVKKINSADGEILNVVSQSGSQFPIIEFLTAKQAISTDIGEERYIDSYPLIGTIRELQIRIRITSDPGCVPSPCFEGRYLVRLTDDGITFEEVGSP